MLGFGLLSLLLSACDLEQPGLQCPADSRLPELEQIEANPYEVVA